MLVALKCLHWESDLFEVFLKEDEVQVVDRFPEHGRVGRLHGAHGLIDKVNLLFEQITPAVNERADVLAEFGSCHDLRLLFRNIFRLRILLRHDWRSEVDRPNELDGVFKVALEDVRVFGDLVTSFKRSVHSLVVNAVALAPFSNLAQDLIGLLLGEGRSR